MIKIQTADSVNFDYKKLVSQRIIISKEVEKKVQDILLDIVTNGDSALIKYSKIFDKTDVIRRIGKAEMKAAYDNCDKAFISSLEKCKENIVKYHSEQVQKGYEIKKDGTIIGQRVRPLKRVGIYVPGGTAAYPSSVLMNAIPASIAGVEEIIMITPPINGQANQDVVAAAYICGISEIILMGGSQGIAALAYGTETIKPVDKIVGPGNIYVATAKKLLYGLIDIDMIAGPSEILIVADETANAKFVAADMLSQAEHDKLAMSSLITTSEKLAYDVQKEIEEQIKNLSRANFARESIDNFGLILIAGTLEKIIEIANSIAPEHLEVLLENPIDYIDKFYNAGSIFLGNYSPEPLGDYYAGPNHVLPTNGTARFSSPLSVDSFIKKYSYIYYPKNQLEKAKDDIINIAKREGLDAHANAVKIRFS